MAKRSSTTVIVFAGLCVVLNIIGGFLALALRLPVYLDTIGTVLCALTLGPWYAMAAGALTGVINGITFDPTSFYYIPVQLIIGFLTGMLFKNGRIRSISGILKIIVITLAGSIVSSIITAFVFSGITSSGSSYIVAALRSAGVGIFSSVFSTQIFTDLLDKFISFFVADLIIHTLPKTIFEKLR